MEEEDEVAAVLCFYVGTNLPRVASRPSCCSYIDYATQEKQNLF
jgi:hypothetical protein